MPHLHESVGQHMLQEPADELERGKRHLLHLLRACALNFNYHLFRVVSDYARVGYCDFEDIGGQVVQHLVAVAHCLDIDVPALISHVSVNLASEPLLLHRIVELRPEDI